MMSCLNFRIRVFLVFLESHSIDTYTHIHARKHTRSWEHTHNSTCTSTSKRPTSQQILEITKSPLVHQAHVYHWKSVGTDDELFEL
jgi:hypothetical protein